MYCKLTQRLTVLNIAVLYGDIEILKLLLLYGADPNIENGVEEDGKAHTRSKYYVPLHTAI